ncbi:HAT repeat-containing protein [Heterostelium album PN500]|uniref:HAT repeat-containing protein n=1 Tax=Heterostelium pallidum (strain ATCC 26659 / Pp 5 / PN500) TaxID=670386 RepID=D3B0T2_HETP5|nr:HAT repeat-containing protein [Heterostelium album PN500]EFA84906.1 HAT repeat-containing protein [Heterostelium album PN500]|eukprot:XP_020437016.1 HAT repeat-containing protein [Heterostelium album PN500]
MSAKSKLKSKTTETSATYNVVKKKSTVVKPTTTATTITTKKTTTTKNEGLVGKSIDIEIKKHQTQNEWLDFSYSHEGEKLFGRIHVTEAEEIDNPLDSIMKQLEERDINTLKATVTSVDLLNRSIQVNAFDRTNLNQPIQPATTATKQQKIPVWSIGRSSNQSNDLIVIVNRNTIGLIDIMSNFATADSYYQCLRTPFKQLYCQAQSRIDANTIRLKLDNTNATTATTQFKVEVDKTTIAMVKQIGTLSMKLVLPGNMPAELKAVDVSPNLYTHPFSIYSEGDLLDVKILSRSATSGILVGTCDLSTKFNPIHTKKPELKRKRINLNTTTDTTTTPAAKNTLNFAGYAYITAIYKDMVRLMLSTNMDGVMMMESVPELFRPYLAVGRHVAVCGQHSAAAADKSTNEIQVTLNHNNYKINEKDVALLSVTGFTKTAMTVCIVGNPKTRGLIYPNGLDGPTAEQVQTIEQIQEQYKPGDILIGRCKKLNTPKNPLYRFSAKESDLEGVDLEKVSRPTWSVEDEPDQPYTINKYKSVDIELVKSQLESIVTETTESNKPVQKPQQQQQWETADFESLSKKRKQPEETTNKIKITKQQQQQEIEAEEDIIEEDDIVDAKKHKQEKKKSKHQIEQDIKEKEDLLSDHNIQPESSQDFERVLLGSPNSSFIWVKYMSFYLGLNEIHKAREIGERALKKIIPTEVLELRNVWIALFNLENMYGSKDSLLKLFQKAIQYQDPKTMYFSIVNILEATSKFDAEEEYFKMFFKKFRHSAKVWCRYGEFLIRANKVDLFHQILKRATESLPKRKQVEVISKFGQLEFKLGEAERGRTIFEGMVSSYPTRTDLWNVYLDMEIKLFNEHIKQQQDSSNNNSMTNQQLQQQQSIIKRIRQLFERTITLKTSDRNIKQFFKRYLQFEKDNGDQQSIEHVKQSALAYVEDLN